MAIASVRYKGYEGLLEIDVEDGVITGQVLGLRDVITFRGNTVHQAEMDFCAAVEDYLAFCAERGEVPELPPIGGQMSQ